MEQYLPNTAYNQPEEYQDNGQNKPEYMGIPNQVQQEELLYAWNAPSRVYKRRDREYYTTIATIVVLLSILAFFANQMLLIVVMWAIAFVSYVLAAVPPSTIPYAITTFGMRINGLLYPWQALGRFWKTERFEQDLIHIEYKAQLINRLTLLAGEGDVEEIQEYLRYFLVNEVPPQTFTDKAAQWLREKFPLESAKK